MNRLKKGGKIEPLLGSYKPIKKPLTEDVQQTQTAKSPQTGKAQLTTQRDPAPVGKVNLGLAVNKETSIEYLRNKRGWSMPPEDLALKNGEKYLQQKREEIRKQATTQNIGKRDESQKLPHITIREQRQRSLQQARRRLHESPSTPEPPMKPSKLRLRPLPRCAVLKKVDKIALHKQNILKCTTADCRRLNHIRTASRKVSAAFLQKQASQREEDKVQNLLTEVNKKLRKNQIEDEDQNLLKEVKQKLRENQREEEDKILLMEAKKKQRENEREDEDKILLMEVRKKLRQSQIEERDVKTRRNTLASLYMTKALHGPQSKTKNEPTDSLLSNKSAKNSWLSGKSTLSPAVSTSHDFIIESSESSLDDSVKSIIRRKTSIATVKRQ